MPRIKVVRDYSGQEGTDVDKNVFAGSEHLVTRARAAELKANGLVEIVSDEAHPDEEAAELRTDGPTVAEFIAAGYQAINYPPAGYASRSSDEEIDAAIAAQKSNDQEKNDMADANSNRDEKAAAAPENKQARAPRNKAAQAPANKAD